MENIDKVLKSLGDIKDWHPIRYKLSQKQTLSKRFENIRKYYNERDELISKDYNKWNTDPYEMDWIKIFSPIERIFWGDIRRIGGVVLYPQYPVINYFIDFANPALKIGVEVDGKKWHDKEKDLKRDKKLLKIGWVIYRIEGWECNNVIHLSDIENKYEYEYNNEYSREHKQSLTEYFSDTSEGFVRALRNIYFSTNYLNFYRRYMSMSIAKHRSIKGY